MLHPVLLYLLLALGAAGVALSLPRRGANPQALGGVLAATAGGLVILLLTLAAVRRGEGPPNVFFYVFSIVALGASLRVITHPRPVYAALYFILTILASAGLYVILAAEFMAFALIIVYAGAILITYLFVIMLATQAPSADESEVLAEYDLSAKEPVAATLAGFAVLAALTTMLFSGAAVLPRVAPEPPDRLLARMPGKAESALREAGLLLPGERVSVSGGSLLISDDSNGTRELPRDQWPEALSTTNVESLAFNLLEDHPGSIEIAGVILLMAMLGSVVLARRKMQLDEDALGRWSASRGGRP